MKPCKFEATCYRAARSEGGEEAGMQGHNVRIKPTARTVPDRPTDPPETEAKTCGTCYYYEPCPCGRCVWGVCRHVGTLFGEYMHDGDLCHEWEEA